MRILNVARLPDERVVWFRHYDPDVLAYLMPLFDAEQSAKVFGSAKKIGFLTGRMNGKFFERRHGLPDPKTGPLTFDQQQMDRIFERQRDLARLRAATTLKEVFPGKFQGLSEREVQRIVVEHEKKASELGLTSERSFASWAYLRTLTDNQVDNNVPLNRFIQRNGRDNVNETLSDSLSEICYDFYYAKHLQNAGISYSLRKIV